MIMRELVKMREKLVHWNIGYSWGLLYDVGSEGGGDGKRLTVVKGMIGSNYTRKDIHVNHDFSSSDGKHIFGPKEPVWAGVAEDGGFGEVSMRLPKVAQAIVCLLHAFNRLRIHDEEKKETEKMPVSQVLSAAPVAGAELGETQPVYRFAATNSIIIFLHIQAIMNHNGADTGDTGTEPES
uniref:Uncharacterized protein n=1 Tax=Onchocerca volvulus TaxID=6282 RepID=A0A8R1XVD5_ONCVO